MSGFNSAKQAKARDLKHRVLTCLHKLSDRDTHSAAASELESIARTLPSDALPPFISSISATDSSDRSPVRRHCVRLISVLSEHHQNSLSPYLSKLLSAIVRRLRDPDSAVRSACVAASLSLSSNLTSPPFASVSKPFLESLFTEQDQSAQTGAALCLAAVIEGSRDPDAAGLRRLLPRLEKLAKCESFRAKAALMALIGSVVEVRGVLGGGGKNVVRNLIACLMDFLSSEDWAARKAAAEALMKIAAVERDSLSEYKLTCLKTFEAKKFDKVKAARETMNQMIETWKQIPDLLEEISVPPESEASSIENASDGRYPPRSTISCSIGSTTPRVWKKAVSENSYKKTPVSYGSAASTARKRTPLGNNQNKTGPAMFRKLDRNSKVESILQSASSGKKISDNGRPNGQVERKEVEKTDTKRAILSENDQKKRLGLFKAGTRVAPCCDDSVVVGNETGIGLRNHQECDELTMIRKQLLRIESKQSNLMDLLQGFIGSSRNGMHSLEARVHGLELALDEISFDLAVSTGRMSRISPARGSMCFKLPGTEYLSSKLWKKAAPTTFGGTHRGRSSEGFAVENRGVIVNPLAKLPSGSVGFSEVSLSGGVNKIAV
ncbi:ARM repeat superfamily protein [Striga asiatica]|uniref:ARM repeat superfamily protein n=1 Tax=Striga asiatica TaxID=4170 RepID=A0A5A7P2Q2_STRAF|nr:ARM repeat superfamily protein [Striga asiatica]